MEITRESNHTANPAGSPRFTETPHEGDKTPFENFEDLTTKLLQVTKEEVDEKRAERENARKRKLE